MTDQELIGILTHKKLLTRERIEEAQLLANSFAQPLMSALLDRGFLEKKVLGEAIGEFYGVEYIDWQEREIADSVLRLIPEETAISQQLMPFARRAKVLSVAFVNPRDFELINFLEKKTSYRIQPYFAFTEDLNRGYAQYKQDLAADFKEIIQKGLPTAISEESMAKIAKDIPVIQAFDTILQYAIADAASDVHLEAQEENAVVRLRIDGILHDILTISRSTQIALVARIKILANLKIDEHRLPQDGRFKFQGLGAQIALRVSIIPSFYGENAVLRLLSESEKPKSLLELGLTESQGKLVTEHSIKSHGMILVTGPTGSGKTTTLYSILHLLNRPEVKLCTVEDPIEYGITRISQIQVNATTGLTFATGLRALLRHDPDIIMVGEIRDSETTTTAIQAALTGHLVLSTLHTNDAPSTIPRLTDLGGEGFLVASTINLVIAQRLVRKICPDCKVPDRPATSSIKEVAAISKIPVRSLAAQSFSRGKGCSRCHGSGYRGRMGIFELFEVTPALQELIIHKATADAIRKVAIGNGMITMFADGVAKAKAGQTTLEEVLRVSRE